MRKRKVACTLIVLPLLLAAGSLVARELTPAAQIRSNAYHGDGDSEGARRTADAEPISIAFMAGASAVRSLPCSYTGQDGPTCTSLAHDEISPEFRSRAAEAIPRLDLSPAAEIGPQIEPAMSSWCGINVDCRNLIFQLLIFSLVNGAILALNAIGVTVIYSTVRTLNLAHGDVFALTSALVTSMINIIGLNLEWPGPARVLVLIGVLVAAIIFGTLLSVGVETAAFRPFRGRSKLAPVIASLGISFMLYQAALVWRTFQKSFIRGEHRSVPGIPEVPTDGIPNFLPHGNLLHGKLVLEAADLFVWTAAILFVLVTTYLLARTRLGRTIRAVAQNAELAQMVGVNRDRAIRHAFALGGALAGAAAFVFALYYGRPFGQAGAQSGLFAFAAALLGGIGSPLGALLSGLVLGVTGSFSDYFLTAQWTPVLILGLLIALLVWRQGGFGGERITEEIAARDSVVLTAPAQNTDSARRRLIGLLIGLAVFPIVSLTLKLGGQTLFRFLGIFILLTLGLNVLLGLAGVLDLGYSMSFAIGGYAAALITNGQRHPIDFILVLITSAALAGLFGALKGGLAGRLRGDYLAVATLALGLITRQIIVNAAELTGGSRGITGLPAPYVFGIQLATPFAQYYLVFVLVIFAAFGSGRLMSSRTGRAWLAASEDETAAMAFGVDTSRYRLLAFLISSAVAGVAGALYVSTLRYIDPDVAAFHITTMMLAMVIVGGAGSVTGAILGTVLVYGYDKFLIPQIGALLAIFWPKETFIGMVPDIRGTNFFNFGIALYLTVLLRARKKEK